MLLSQQAARPAELMNEAGFDRRQLAAEPAARAAPLHRRRSPYALRWHSRARHGWRFEVSLAPHQRRTSPDYAGLLLATAEKVGFRLLSLRQAFPGNLLRQR